MKSKEYIEKFNLTNRTFNREAFLQALGEEFEEKLKERQQSEYGLDYHMFKHYIDEMEDKFRGISKKVPGGLTKNLWGAFYASQIVRLRAIYCPKDHQEIIARREKYTALKDKREKEKEKESQGYYEDYEF